MYIVPQRRRGQEGQILVLAAFTIVVFLAFLGLVVDVGNLYVVRQRLRNACDAAAGAGASKIPSNSSGCLQYAFRYYCANAGGTAPGSPASGVEYTIAGTGDRVTVTTPYGDSSDSARKVRVQARRTVPSLVMKVAGSNASTVGTYAVGVNKASQQSYVSAFAGNGSGGRTQPLNYRRPDNERFAMVIRGNNVEFGYDENNQLVGWVTSAQNVYLRSNNGVGQISYGEGEYSNSISGNNLSVGLRTPALSSIPSMAYIDPAYYQQQAANAGPVYTGNQSWSGNNKTYGSFTVNNGNLTISGNNVNLGQFLVTNGNVTINANNIHFNGFYYVNGNLNIIGNNPVGTATFAASGYINVNGNNVVIHPADTENHLTFYAGANAALGGDAYFASPQFSANSRYLMITDNNLDTDGTLYAPYGYAYLLGNNIHITGAVVADSVAIDGNNAYIRFDPDLSPPATPGIMLLE